MPVRMSAVCKEIYMKDDANKSVDKLSMDSNECKYNYSSRHPAYKLIDKHGFDLFYRNLKKEIASKKGLRIIRDKMEHTTYELCNYNCNQFKIWNEYMMICRGIIIDLKSRKIIAASFPKFFNYEEYHKTVQNYICNQFNAKIDDKTDDNDEEKKKNDNNDNNDNNDDQHGIFEKLDGSLGICFYCQYSKKWRISTRGDFGSPQAQWANTYIFDRNLNKSLIKGHTYLFEIIYKENKIGVNYGNFEGLILLTAYNDNGFEYKYEYLKIIASSLRFKVAACYNKKYKNIDDLLSAQKLIDKNKEGFVVCLHNGFRIKFKGDQYLNMRKTNKYSGTEQMRKNIKTMIIMNGIDDKKNVLKQYEEEFHKEVGSIFDNIYGDLLKKTENCVHDLLMTNNLSKSKLSQCQQKLNNDVKFIARARKICDQNLWKSYLGAKSNKKLIGKCVHRITNQLLEQKEWRIFITKRRK